MHVKPGPGGSVGSRTSARLRTCMQHSHILEHILIDPSCCVWCMTRCLSSGLQLWCCPSVVLHLPEAIYIGFSSCAGSCNRCRPGCLQCESCSTHGLSGSARRCNIEPVTHSPHVTMCIFSGVAVLPNITRIDRKQ